MANGWSVLAAYTYAHSLDNGPAPFDLKSSSAPQSPFDLDPEYATSAADLKHNVTLSNQIELPFGRGKRYLRSTGAADRCPCRRMAPEHHHVISYRNTGQHRVERRIRRLSGVAARPGAWPESQLCLATNARSPNGLTPRLLPTRRGRATASRFLAMRGGISFAAPGTPMSTSRCSRVFRFPRDNLQFRAESFNLLNTPHYRQSECQPQFGLLWFHHVRERSACDAVCTEAHLLTRHRRSAVDTA